MSNHTIEIHDLSKIYTLKGQKKVIKALNNVNLSVEKGEIFGLLGPNGAGKTTLIHILTTIKQPTSGYALIDGYDVVKNPLKAKTKISLMLESSMLYNRITGYDNLKFFCKIYNVPNHEEKINSIAKEFGLEKWLNQYVEHFSSGMKMKLALCRTLIIDRPILFLDEPTLGLDVKSVTFIIKKLKKMNKTILLTSHDMNVVEKLCGRIAFINKGNIIKAGTKSDIANVLKREVNIEISITGDKNPLRTVLNQEKYVNEVQETKQGLIITLSNREYYKDLLSILSKYNIFMVKELEPSIEDLFLKII